MQLSKRLSRALFFSYSITPRTLTTLSPSPLSHLLSSPGCHSTTVTPNGSDGTRLLDSPWSLGQRRGAKVNAIHIRAGNVIEKTGHVYRVVEVAHKQQGRGGAMMQLELRDVDSGNKVSLRFGTEEPVEKVFVEEKSFTCLYTEDKTAFLIEPDTFEQLEVSLDLFGKAAAYLKDEMKVTVQLYDGRPLSGSIPKHVTCTIKETQPPMKGLTSAPRYKKALLDNGLIVQVPAYLETGEEIIINTEDNSFIKRLLDRALRVVKSMHEKSGTVVHLGVHHCLLMLIHLLDENGGCTKKKKHIFLTLTWTPEDQIHRHILDVLLKASCDLLIDGF